MNTTLSPYLNFNGNAREAMQFYQSVLGGELTMQSFAESGMQTEEKYKDQIIHAHLQNGSIIIMASDMADHGSAVFGTSVNLSLSGSDMAGLTEAFHKLSEGGKVDMPLAKQFWGDTYGMLTDRYGIHWMVNISTPKE